jgi:SsrA-binding protein
MQQKINIKNKKVYHDYEIEDKYIAGIQLKGTEIKSIRKGKASLVDTFCSFKEGELFIRGMYISEYAFASFFNHEPKRERKLLLNKKELKKLERKTKEKGYTIVATQLFLTKEGWAKVEIALGRGKKEYDKRETLKRKDVQRQLDRMMKH